MRTIEMIIHGPTLEDARAWEATTDQFTFCIDWLEISAHSTLADGYVNKLEDRFEKLIETDEFLKDHFQKNGVQ